MNPWTPLLRVCAMLMLIATVWFQSDTRGAAQGQLVLKLATSMREQSPWGQALMRFATHVHEGSHGKIHVRIFFEGALGPDVDQVERVALGTLHAFAGPVDALAVRVPAMRALETPGLFATDADVVSRLTRGSERIDTLLNAGGLRLGSWLHAGFRSRFVARGSNAIEMLTPIAAFASGTALRTQRVVVSRDALAAGALVYSQRWFDGLPAQTKDVLAQAPAAMGATLTQEIATTEARLLQALKERGIDVHEATPSEQRSGRREMIDAHLASLDDNGRALYRQLLAAPAAHQQ